MRITGLKKLEYDAVDARTVQSGFSVLLPLAALPQ
jgi:hypothetical protein